MRTILHEHVSIKFVGLGNVFPSGNILVGLMEKMKLESGLARAMMKIMMMRLLIKRFFSFDGALK